jgi:hypothetical protein
MTKEWRHQTQTARRIAPMRGIRSRLMVLAIIAVVPLVLSRIYDERGDRAERIAAAFRQARELAQDGADKQNEYLATARSFLKVIARSYPTFGGSGEACGQFLARLALGLSWTRGISVAGPDGRIVGSSNPPAVGMNISDRSHFQEAMKRYGPAISSSASTFTDGACLCRRCLRPIRNSHRMARSRPSPSS